MTTPEVPVIFAGDELGLKGSSGHAARRTMPWDQPELWDERLLREYVPPRSKGRCQRDVVGLLEQLGPAAQLDGSNQSP
jgi:hypothetical protein